MSDELRNGDEPSGTIFRGVRYSDRLPRIDESAMSYRPPLTENGGRVNAIKEKFERNARAGERHDETKAEETKDCLRRSLSASPMRSRNNSRPDASRQLSNPGKNIKRTPAFRGEKPARAKILHSPVKDCFGSIVDRNVRLFESERPESRGTGVTVDEKFNGADYRFAGHGGNGAKEASLHSSSGTFSSGSGKRERRSPTTENGVRTTVISRQRDISSINSRRREDHPETFFENGVEYTRARKRLESDGEEESSSSRASRDSWRRRRTSGEKATRRDDESEEDEERDCSGTARFNDLRLRAALRAPLPPGPPPKKPPRTFAHRRCRDEPSERSDSRGVNPEREPRDSRRMLEKLENVLVEHRSALGARVVTPSRRNEMSSSTNLDPARDSTKRATARASESDVRKSPTLDCLPLSLNCASSRGHRPSLDKPDFASHLPFFLVSPANSQFYRDPSTTRMVDSPTNPSVESLDAPDGRTGRRDSSTMEERVYAEPFAFDKNSGTDITGYGITIAEETGDTVGRFARDNSIIGREAATRRRAELHYMCTSLEPSLRFDEDNNNVTENPSDSRKIQRRSAMTSEIDGRSGGGGEGKIAADTCPQIGVEESLNRAFGKFAVSRGEIPNDSNESSDTDSLGSSSATSTSDEVSSFGDKLRLFKNWENTRRRSSRDEVHRSLTEKRKNYVRRVSLKYSERPEEIRPSHDDGRRRDRLFRVCLLIELNLSTREPYIKDRYPSDAKAPAWIENFCFPDATDWPRGNHSTRNQFHSLALMDERGNRLYGYCRRVRPENGPVLPLAYCLITDNRASGFYHRVLLELESRHGLPDKRRKAFIAELYDGKMPKPGQCLRIKGEPLDRDEHRRTTHNNNLVASKPKMDSRMTGAEREGTSVAPVTEENPISPDDSNFRVIARPSDPRLEESDMSQLFDAVTNRILLVLFGSLLLERRVVLLSDQLGKLSSCVEALQSLLYPFVWPHTFVPVLPDIPGLSEILQAPLPFVIGIFKSNSCTETRLDSLQDGIAVDLDTSKIVCEVGDESSILPTRLQKNIRNSLQLVSSGAKSPEGIRNFLVSEAFLRTFVETCSHYDHHVVTQQDGRVIFQKESFVKASSSKSEQYFLEWFVETTMFTTFVRDFIERMDSPEERDTDDVKFFHQRVAEYRRGIESDSRTKRGCCSKKKTLGDRLKDLANFHA